MSAGNISASKRIHISSFLSFFPAHAAPLKTPRTLECDEGRNVLAQKVFSLILQTSEITVSAQICGSGTVAPEIMLASGAVCHSDLEGES